MREAGLSGHAARAVIPVERPFASRVITLYRREGELLQADAKACHAALRKAAAAVRARKRGT